MSRPLKLLLALILMASAVPLLRAQSGEVEQFTMPKKDGRQGDKEVDGSLMFYDMGGPTGNTAGYYAGYTRFIPASGQQQIRITFNSLELTGAASVYVYDGDIEFKGYSSAVPEGYLAKLSGTVSDAAFESSTGSLSVLYHCSGSGSGAGWAALVEEFVPADMVWGNVTVSRGATTAFRGQRGAPVMCVNLTTEGSRNPIDCHSLSFTLDGAVDLAAVRDFRVISSGSSATPAGSEFGISAGTGSRNLSFEGKTTLRSGNNYFWLVADVDPDAAGATLGATLTGVTAAGEQRVAAPMGCDGTVTVSNEARMQPAHLTYSVGPAPLALYDDGGAEGNITQGFSGTATFRPVTPGSKLRIRFTGLDLFSTSTVGLNDQLNVYAGTGTDAADLIATVLTEPLTVSSTAPDGSLTVSLVSTAGTPKGGFAAIVEEFVPQAMEISGINATCPFTATASAGESGVKMLLIDVSTVNTEPALSIGSMTFANSSTAPVAKAALYSLGATPDGTPAAIGEALSPSESFTITMTQPVTLSERHNYFLLTFTPGDRAVTGQTLRAALTKVDNRDAGAEAPANGIEIENRWLSATGNHIKTIYGNWIFANTPSTSSYYGYDDTAGAQTTTFLPGTTGSVIELDFTKFKLMTSSYIPAPTFTVYDGADTSAPVLWQVSSATMTTGPDRTLRATNSAGALTVVFNANGGRGSIGYGFEAKVNEYVSTPMKAEAVSASQLSDGEIIRPAATDVAMLAISMTMSGDLNPLTLDALTLDLKGCHNAVKAVKLYHTGREDAPVDASATLVARAEVSGPSVTLVPSPSFTMPEKTSAFRVCFDMADSFGSDLAVDAAVSSLKLGGKTVAVDNADPEGSAVTKNMYFFEGGEKQLRVDGSLLFYDDGGPEGKYTTAAKGSVTFLPAAPGQIIRMTVNSFWTNYQDYLYFYDGASPQAGASPLLSLSSSKTADDIPVILSKADDGAITVTFEPKKNNINNGWEILVESITPRPMAVTAVEVTPVNDVKMLRGSTDNKLLKVAVTVDGDKGKVDLSRFEFSALESDMAAMAGARLWYTGEADSFDLNTPYGAVATEAPMVFTGSMEYDAAGTFYYWLACNIDPLAETGAKVQAQFTSLTAGQIVHTPAADNLKVLVTVQEGMHGVYTVGTGGDSDFRTLAEAVDAMTGGIDGPVIFELEDGNYNELVSIPEVTGSSELNTVTIRSRSGNRDNVILSYNTYRDPGSANYDKRYGVVTFDGIDHCTLENLTVTTTATNFPALVFLRNKSEHITLRNCVVRTEKSTDSAKGCYLIGQYAKNEAYRNNNFMTVENCLLDGGYIGVGFTGASAVALPKQRGGTVRDCVFRNQGSKAIYINMEEDATVCRNDIFTDGQTTSSYNGMDISDAGGDLEIHSNVIRVKDPEGTYTPNPCGIYVRGYNVDKLKNGSRRIYNNEINLTGCPGSTGTALRVNTEYPGLEIVSNTMLISSSVDTGDRVYGIYMAGGIPGGRIVNNIVQCATPGHVIYAQRRPYLANAVMSNNVMHTAGDNFAYIGQDPDDASFTAGARSFDEFCAVAPMTASHCEAVSFLSENVLEPAEAGSLVSALPVDYVRTDLYGAERSSTAPTVGAYEYAESTVAPAPAEGYPEIREVAHDRVTLAIRSTLTGMMHAIVRETAAEAPTAAEVKESGNPTELRKGVEKAIVLDGLTPNTVYTVYGVISSLRGIDSEVIRSAEFTTSYEPTRPATFEDAVAEDSRITDGTMTFTGFTIAEITDGVDPQPNARAAAMDDDLAIVQLTNAVNLPIQGMFMRNSAAVTLTAKDDELRTVATKTADTSETWRYVDLLDMGRFTYLELESDGSVMIDNFGSEPLELTVAVAHDEAVAVSAGKELALEAAISGGVAPYTCVWTNALRQEVGTGAVLTYTPGHSEMFGVSVTDARGNKAAANIKVRVLGPIEPATFDDLYLAGESHWFADTEAADYTDGSFFSGSFEFDNHYVADWFTWSGFAYSNHTATDYSSYLTDQWNSAAGCGALGSANYGVAYVSGFMGKTVCRPTNAADGQMIPGMYVTNSAWVVDAILNGDGMEPEFAHGDMLTLHLTATDPAGKTSAIDIPLADYTADDEADRWYLDTWQWVDLSALGNVASLEWNVISTKANDYGTTTPTYVCFDNLGAERPVASGDAVTLMVNEQEPEASFSIAPYFGFDASEATVSYDIECADRRVSIDGSTVTCSADPGDELTLIAHASQRGHHEWVEIPVKMEAKPLGIAAPCISGVAVYPNPADAYFTVSADAETFTLEIISMDGRTLLRRNIDASATISTDNLANGSYMLRLISPSGAKSLTKLIIRH